MMDALSLKNRMIAASRALRILALVDRVKLLASIISNAPRNARFRREVPGYPVPRYADAYDAYSHINWSLYRTSGIEHASILAAAIKRHVPVGGLQVLEWGCGPGRVIRHLGEYLPDGCAIHGTDINPSTIDWCRQHLPGIRFSLNQLVPPLRYADQSMDVVIARSVFTHLSEANHLPWKQELLRVLRPGGVLLVTTSGNYLADMHLTPEERIGYSSGQLVVRSGVREGTKWYATFHSPDYMRNIFCQDVQVLEHRQASSACFAQDLWVVRKA